MFTQLSGLGGSVTQFPFLSYGMGDVCKNCGKTDFVNDTATGDRICTYCGNVQLQNMLSEEPEWRSYKEEGRGYSFHSYLLGNAYDDARVNTLSDSIIPSNSLSTDFILDGRDLDAKSSKLMKRMEDPQELKRTRKLLTIHSIIQEAANQLDVTQNVPICAFDIYSRCFTLMHIRGKRSEVIVSACFYLACRLTGCYRLLSEIVGVVLADIRKVTHLTQIIITELKLSVPIPSDQDYIRRYCACLMLPAGVSTLALRLVDCIREGKYPNVAGTALNAVGVLMASRLCDVEDAPSVELLATIASKSEKNVVRLYKAVYTHCDSILVALYKDDAAMTAKGIMKMTQKLDPKRL